MNISYNWLKEYVNFDLTPEQVAAALTSIGLETGEVEEVQCVRRIECGSRAEGGSSYLGYQAL